MTKCYLVFNFYLFILGVHPLLFMDGHATIFFFFGCHGRTCNMQPPFFFCLVSVHFCSWADMQPSFFVFFRCPSTFVHGRTYNFILFYFFFIFYFFFRVHPLFSWTCISFFVRPLFSWTCIVFFFFFGRGLVEVTKCYLVTLLVVHLGSWTC